MTDTSTKDVHLHLVHSDSAVRAFEALRRQKRIEFPLFVGTSGVTPLQRFIERHLGFYQEQLVEGDESRPSSER